MKRSLFVVFGAVYASMSMNAFSADPIVLATWGGTYAKSQEEEIIKPYFKETKIKVIMDDYSGGMAELRAQVETGSNKWDIIDMLGDEVTRACDEGLLEELDLKALPNGADGTPAAKDFIEGALNRCGIGNDVWSTILAYNTKAFKGEQPSTIADFFDTKRFPGKRGKFRKPQVNLEWALIADGVPSDQVYKTLSTEEGLTRAFKKLDSIKSDIIWLTTAAQTPQLLASGEINFSVGYNARIQDAIDNEKQPFEIIWDHQFVAMNMFVIPKGSPKKKISEDFIRYATEAKQTANQTRWITYAPARQSGMKLITPEVAEKLPTTETHMKTAIRLDHDWWADHAEELSDRFNVWSNN